MAIDIMKKQAKAFACVVEQVDHTRKIPYIITPQLLQKELKHIGASYFAILHDFDYKEDGTKERNHYHIVLQFGSRHRVGAIIKKLAFNFGCDPLCVSVIPSTDIIRDIRYLIHLDEDGEKTAYPVDDIMTNDRRSLDYALSVGGNSLDIDTLQAIVTAKKGNRLEIIRELGLNTYARYRSVINDLIADIRAYGLPYLTNKDGSNHVGH